MNQKGDPEDGMAPEDTPPENDGATREFVIAETGAFQLPNEPTKHKTGMGDEELDFSINGSASAPESITISGGREFADYLLGEEIARGGMGVVFRAQQISLNRPVAIKMILAGQLASEEDVRRFYTEAEAAAKLDHPNIVPIYEVGQHEDIHYFSMKLIEGGDLGKLLPTLRKDLPSLIRLLEQVCRAVGHAHQRGILHRDLKPANILVDQNQQPYVTDLGLARPVDGDSQITRTGAIVGTPSYMSPEQAAGNSDLTIASDIFSLGSIIYEAICGRPPFQGNNPMETLMQVMHDAPTHPTLSGITTDRSLELISLKCLEKQPAQRYPTAIDLADDLKRWLNGEPVSIRAPSLAATMKQWLRQNFGSAWWILVVGMVGGLVAGLGLWSATIQREFPAEQNWVYSQLSSVQRPATLLNWTTPDWLVTPSLLLCFGAIALLGYFTALLARTRNTGADIAAGLLVGVIAGTGAFFFAVAVIGITVSLDTADLDMLGQLARAPIDETPPKLADLYPEIEQLDRERQVAIIKSKIRVDQTASISRGILLAVLTCALLFVCAGIVETMIAGRILRAHKVWWRGLAAYLFSALPYVSLSFFIGIHLAAYLFFGRPGIVLDWLTALSILCLAVGVFAEFRHLRSTLRFATFVLSGVGMLIFLLIDFPDVPSVAKARQQLADSQHRAEAYRNARTLFSAANSYQSAGVTLYDAGRIETANAYFEDGVRYLESLPELESDYRLQGVLATSYANLANIAWVQNAPQKSIDLLKEAVEQHPENAQLLAKCVFYLDQTGFQKEKQDLFENYKVTNAQEFQALLAMVYADDAGLPGLTVPYRSVACSRKIETLTRLLKQKELPQPTTLEFLKESTLLQHWIVVHPNNRDSSAQILDRLLAETLTLPQSARAMQVSPLYGEYVDLASLLPNAGDHTTVFLIGEIYSPIEQTVQLTLGSDDGFELWHNQTSISRYNGSRPFTAREDRHEISLTPGPNRLLLKIDQNQGPWGFSLQVETLKGWPATIEWLKPSTDST